MSALADLRGGGSRTSSSGHRPGSDRFASLEINALATFVVTDMRRASTEELIAQRGWSGVGVAAVWDMPTIFIGNPDQIRADLHERRDRFGLSYLVTGESGLPALAEIISGL